MSSTIRPLEKSTTFCVCVLTFDRVKEVEEGVVGDLFGNSADSATAFMLLLLLNSFHSHILPLVPVYLTAREEVWEKKSERRQKACTQKR